MQDEVLVAPYNDLEAVAALLREHGKEIAAIIVEPFQRLIPPRPGFLEGLRKLTQEHGIVLIFDEVVTGFRFAYGGAQAYYGITPDLCTLGKAIGGGFPLAAIAGPAEIMAHFDKGKVADDAFLMQVGTLSGNPMAAAAGLKTLEILKRPGAYERIHKTGRAIMDAYAQILKDNKVKARLLGDAPMFDIVFTQAPEREIHDYRGAQGRRRLDAPMQWLAARARHPQEREQVLHRPVPHRRRRHRHNRRLRIDDRRHETRQGGVTRQPTLNATTSEDLIMATRRFENKVVLITGAQRGFGGIAANRFAAEGAKLVLCDISADGIAAKAAELKAKGHAVEHLAADVSKEETHVALVGSGHESLWPARHRAEQRRHRPQERAPARHRRGDHAPEFDVNVMGVFLGMKHQIPALLKGGGGAITNTASVAGVLGATGLSAYVAAKHAVVGLTKTAAGEFASKGIRVNAVCPGIADTAMAGELLGQMGRGDAQAGREKFEALLPSKRMARPEEIVEGMLFASDPANSYMNGHCLIIDGAVMAV